MRVSVLRNGTRVPKVGFAAAKYPSKWCLGCEIGIFHVLGLRSRFTAAKWGLICYEVALMCQTWFCSCENFCREGPEAANWFCSKVLISQRLRNLADPCFCPIFALFLLHFCSVFAPNNFPSFLLQFLLILIIQKPILHQNKLELKH